VSETSAEHMYAAETGLQPGRHTLMPDFSIALLIALGWAGLFARFIGLDIGLK